MTENLSAEMERRGMTWEIEGRIFRMADGSLESVRYVFGEIVLPTEDSAAGVTR